MYCLYLYTYVCTYVCVADSVSVILFGVVAEIESLILCYLSVTIEVNFLFFFL